MTPFTVYDDAGVILRSGFCPADHVAFQARSGEYATPFESNDLIDYVLGGVVTARPTMLTEIPKTTVADGTTPVVLHDVPAGARIDVRGPTSTSGTTPEHTDVTLTFAIAGDYIVTVECFPYITVEGAIHAA